MAARLEQASNHLSSASSATYPHGMLAGQVAIITGSGQGIGAETARLFAKEGARVTVTDIDAKKAEAVMREIISAGGKAISIPGDIMDSKFPEQLVEETVQKFGGLNIIVNNAGFTYDGVLHKMTDKQWETMLTVHNTAPFRVVRAAAKYFRQKDQKNKVIINVSSSSGLHGNAGQANYATAKMGIVGLTKTIAKEWGPLFGVRANTVAYGFIDTRLTRAKEEGESIKVGDQEVKLGIPGQAIGGAVKGLEDIPLRRPGSVTDAAGGILLLASPFASYISGHTLEVTGGRGI